MRHPSKALRPVAFSLSVSCLSLLASATLTLAPSPLHAQDQPYSEPVPTPAEPPSAPEQPPSTTPPADTGAASAVAPDALERPADDPAPAAPRERATYRIQRTTAAIDTNGHLDEAPWQGPPTFTLEYEVYPGDNTKPLVETAFWLTFDDRNLYVAARAHEPDPASIRARLRDRDNAFQDDFVGIILDTFNDEARAFEFFVNPLGVQMDLFQNEVTGGEDTSWDTLWDSAGRLTETGYEVEMTIPFSSIRFPRADGVQIWGVDAIRIHPRDLRRNNALSPRERGRNCYLCQTAKLVGVEGVTPGLNLELVPTVVANQTAVRNASDDFDTEDDFDPGISGRWSPTPNLTLNAAVNPDFSQVEADAAQLTVNTAFALSFPEKRPFFLEGADLFQTRIGAVDTRTIVDPDWGIKASGKEGKNAFGTIVAEDSRTSLIIPSSQFSRSAFLDEENTSAILRYRRDLPRQSYVGGIYTGREGTGYHNRVAGFDTLLRWGTGDAFRVELLHSETQYPGAIALDFGQQSDSFDGQALRAVYQHTTRTWQGYALYNEITEGFRGDLGFFPQSDFRSAYLFTERYLYGEDGKDWYSRVTYGAETTQKYDHDGNGLQRQFAPYAYLNGPKQSFFQVYVGIGDRYFAGKQFDDNFVIFTAEAQVTGSTFLHLDGRIGQAIDFGGAREADVVTLTPIARFDLGRHLRLELSDIHQTLDVAGGRLFTIDLAELRATYQINVRSFVRVVSQYQDLERDPTLFSVPVQRESRDLFNQLLFSYKLNPQTVLFLGYSDGYFGGDPSRNWLTQSDRTIFAKVGYAFVW